MEKENTERKRTSRYKLRSSLKKSTKNSQGSSDISDEGEDMTLPPPPRRVSFAASSTVKPFVNDPEKNTIWDMTYEEEINHTDSGNVISTHIITNMQGTMGINASMVASDESNFNINEIFRNVQDTPVPRSLIFADSIQCQELPVEEKENIHVYSTRTKRLNSISDRSLRARKPVKSSVKHTETLIEPCDMSLTCRFDPPTQTETILGSCDMSLTCQFNVPNKSLRTRNPLMETVLEPADMELTCQFKTPQIIYTSKEPVDETNLCQYEDDMEFTCMPTQNQEHSIYPIYDNMDFTCNSIDQNIINGSKKNTQAVTNTNTSSDDLKVELPKLIIDKTIDAQQCSLIDTIDQSIINSSKKNTQAVTNTNTSSDDLKVELPKLIIDKTIDAQQCSLIDTIDQSIINSSKKNTQAVTNTNTSSDDLKVELPKLIIDKTIDAQQCSLIDTIDQSIINSSKKNTQAVTNTNTSSDDLKVELPKLIIDKTIDAQQCSLIDTIDQSIINSSKKNTQAVTNTNTSSDDLKVELPKLIIDETIDAQQCSLIDTLTSIIDENSFVQKTPPKVIYSQPMEIKRSNSTLDFTMPSSSKKRVEMQSIGSIDDTQQLLQATILKPFFLHEKSGSTLSPTRILNASQRILDEIEQHLVPYQQLEKYDHEGLDREINEVDEVLKIGKQLEEFAPFEMPLESEYDKLIYKILTESKDTFQFSSSDDDSFDENSAPEPWWHNLHQKILEVFNSTEEEILNLEDSNEEECYYVFSTFSRMVWFAVDLLSKDGVVIDIRYLSAVDNNCKSLNRTLYEFIVKDTQHKTQMYSLKSSLGSTFDMLTLLDHVKIITEKNFNFCLYYMKIQSKHASLRISGDGVVSFQILCEPSPRILWKLAFRLASVEKIEQGSLTATSEFDGTIHLDHLNIILRNIEPGLNCIGRFIDEVLVYFKRTQLGKHKTKGVKMDQTVPGD